MIKLKHLSLVVFSVLLLTGCVSHASQSSTYGTSSYDLSDSSSQYEMYDSDIEKCWNDSTLHTDKVTPASCSMSHDYEILSKGSCSSTYVSKGYDYYTIQSDSGYDYCIKSTIYSPYGGSGNNYSGGSSSGSYGYGDMVQGYKIVSTSGGCTYYSFKKDGYEYADFTSGFSKMCGEKYVGSSDSTNYNITSGETYQGYYIVSSGSCTSLDMSSDYYDYYDLTIGYKTYCGRK
jgi:hypothetical protein